MPIEVHGDVEWCLNRNNTGWLVTLLNPAGQAKPAQGITPTDFRENRRVAIHAALPITTAADWLFPDEKLTPQPQPGAKGASLELTVPAGGVRIIEMRDRSS